MGFAGLTGLPMSTRSGDFAADALFIPTNEELMIAEHTLALTQLGSR